MPRGRSAILPRRYWPLLAAWAAHALALMAWAYVAGISVAAAAPANHHHAASRHDGSSPAPLHHDHERCSLCPLVAGSALPPPIFMLAHAPMPALRSPQRNAPAEPFARADLVIADARGPPSAR